MHTPKIFLKEKYVWKGTTKIASIVLTKNNETNLYTYVFIYFIWVFVEIFHESNITEAHGENKI